RRRHTRSKRDWSSDVCSSDLERDAMVAQLRHVLEFASMKHVTVHVIPEETAWHPGLEGAFSLLDFTAADPIVHLETRRSGLFLRSEERRVGKEGESREAR